jgi:gliding motility-associated-like protein
MKTMKKIFTLLILLAGIAANAQDTPPQIEWRKVLGDSGNDGNGSWDILPTDDGGYVVAASSFYQGDGDIAGGNGSGDFWVIKLDAAGAITWQESYGGSGDEALRRISKAPGGGYFLAGYTFSNDGDVGGNNGSSYYSDWWIVKIDEAGAIIWEKNFGGTGDETLYDGSATEDGGYIAVGSAASANGDVVGNHNATGYTSDGWVVKLDSAGNIEWQRCYGGLGGTNLIAIQPTPDGGYITVGETEALGGDIPLTSYGKLNAVAIKIDATGNVEWSKLFGGNNIDGFSDVKVKEDGSYIITGITDSNDGDISFSHTIPGSWSLRDVWVVDLDIDGNLVWEKTYGGTGNEGAFQIHITGDCGYALAGSYIYNDFEGHPVRLAPEGVGYSSAGIDGFLMKIDTEGAVSWVKTMGGSQNDRIWNFALTPDGGFVTVGSTNSIDGDAIGNHTIDGWYDMFEGTEYAGTFDWYGSFDNWIIKLGPDCEVPQFTTDTSVEVCNGGDVTLSVTTTGQKVSWYDSADALTPVFTGAELAVTNVTSNTSYWVEVSNCRCISPRVQVAVTVNPIPVVTVEDTATCSGTAATITAASAGNTINWYSSETGTTVLFTGEEYTTPVLSANTSYWAEAVSQEGCISERVETTVTVNALPVVSAQDATACAGNTAVIMAASAGNTINWYSSATDATVLFTGTDFTTPQLSANTSYWVAAVSPSGCTSARTEVAVTISTLPVVSAQNVETCAGTATTVTASSQGNTVNWYSSGTATEVLFAGAEFTTPTLSANTSYWVEAVSPEGCRSGRTEVSVTVNALPVVTAANTNSTICEGTTAALTAAASGSSLVVWFDSATATEPLATGTEFTTSELMQSTSYWVAAYDPITHCISPKVQYIITVNDNSTPVVQFNYQENYCLTSDDDALPILAGGFTAGGTFSTSGGLQIDPGTGEINISDSMPGTYVVVYEVDEDPASCLASGRYEAEVTISSCEIQRGISPNGDQYNQYLDLTGLGVSKLSIFNRYGKEVYGAANYTKEWEGQDSHGNELPDGTYFYAISKNDGKQLTGWVYINREN